LRQRSARKRVMRRVESARLSRNAVHHKLPLTGKPREDPKTTGRAPALLKKAVMTGDKRTGTLVRATC
jgi:hypothetical protein